MAVHLTPLRRNQLLDLGKLMETVQHASSVSSSTASFDGSTSGCASEEHPFTCGEFCDVLEDPLTRRAWRLHDKMLYFVWWSHRPPCCAECGMRDAWVPSADSEMKCWHCGTGAGTTSGNDIVEDVPAMGNEDDGDDGDSVDNDVGDNAAEGGSGGGGAVALYMFFYEWLSRMQLMERGKGVVLPTGESLSAVLRAAHDLALLFVVPDLPSGGVTVLQGGALYLSLVLHRFPAPFPLFCLAGSVNASNDSKTISNTTTTTTTTKTSDGCNNNNNNNNGFRGAMADGAAVMGGEQQEELQWVDVELLAALIGVSLSDFFESSQVAVQYLQNIMTVAAAFSVPSVLWHPHRVEGRMEYMMALRQRRRCFPSLHSTAMSSGLSPENTAMIVALELARAFDARPSSAEHAERIGAWLDKYGLYPQRDVYRSDGGDKANGYNQDHPSAQQSCTNGGDVSNKMNTTATTAGVEVDNGMSWASPLTTETSPFAGVMQLVLLSPCANALLYVFASAFSMSALELANMAVSSGLYTGPTRFFETLRQAAESGNYTLMSLSRRLSPITSAWTTAYFAVHSEDRLPLLTALQHIRLATTRDKEVSVARIIQRILRKHQASRRYQFNYSIRVTDDLEKHHFKGVYFLGYVTERFAVYIGIRSARKTVTFDAETGKIILCTIGAKEQHVDSLNVQFNGPIVANIETESAKRVIDCVQQSLGAESWQLTARHLSRCGRVRRRMRVPMLASRLNALESAREATALASHSTAGAATLLGWGETELLFTSLPPVHTPVHLMTLRHELQQNLFSLPKPSLVFGISENRVIAMYASLVALLEYIEQRVLRQSHSSSTSSSSLPLQTCGSSATWVDVLLGDEELRLDASPPRSKELPPAGHNSGAPGSPVQLPASTAALKREPRSPQRTRGAAAPPAYHDVMLQPDGGRLPPPPRERQQQRTRPGRAGRAGHTAAPSGVNCAVFNLFSAEECRKRLHRLLQFIAAYTAQKRRQEKCAAAAVGTSETTTPATRAKTVIDETNGIISAAETLPAARKDLFLPLSNHHHQHPSQLPASLREKTTPKHSASFVRNGSSPLLLPQSSPRQNQTSTVKSDISPIIGASQQQRRHHHHHRLRRSRSSTNHSEESEQGGRGLSDSAVLSSGRERSPCPQKRSRVRNGFERKGDINKKDCSNGDGVRVLTPLPSSSSSSLSSRSSSVGGSSSNGNGSAHLWQRQKRRRKG